MAKGRKNNKNRRGGFAQNTTHDDSNLAQNGSSDANTHHGFSTGAFGAADIDVSGQQNDIVLDHRLDEFGGENQDWDNAPTSNAEFGKSSFGKQGFASVGASQFSVRSRGSIGAVDEGHRMSRLSIQTNQDEFVLVPGSGGQDGHASIRSMHSHISRQSGNAAVTSRDNILTEADETEGRINGGMIRSRANSRASQMSRTSRASAFGANPQLGDAVDIPFNSAAENTWSDERPSGTTIRSRTTSEANGNDEWETVQNDGRRSRASLYSNKSGAAFGGVNDWRQPSNRASRASIQSVHSYADEASAGFGQFATGSAAVPSHHASRASIHSHRGDEVATTDARYAKFVTGFNADAAPSHHASQASIQSRRSNATEAVPATESKQFDVGFGSATASSHHASRASIRSGFGHESTGFGNAVTSHHASRTSMGPGGDGQWNDQEREIFIPTADGDHSDGFGGSRAPSHHASRASLRSHNAEWEQHGDDGYGDHVDMGSRQASLRGSKMSMRSNASGWAVGSDEVFIDKELPHHASRTELNADSISNNGEWNDGYEGQSTGFGYGAPSHHASRTSVHSNQVVPTGISSKAPSHHASKASIHSCNVGVPSFGQHGSRAPSHHASRASIRSHQEWQDHVDDVVQEEDEDDEGDVETFGFSEGGQAEKSHTSARSQMSCICDHDADDTEEQELAAIGMPKLGDEIEVPLNEDGGDWQAYDNPLEEHGGFGDAGANDDWEGPIGDFELPLESVGFGHEAAAVSRSIRGSRASMGSQSNNVGRVQSHHASRMSMRSNVGFDENDNGGVEHRSGSAAQVLSGGFNAPIPALRISRANVAATDVNHNRMGSQMSVPGFGYDEEQQQYRHDEHLEEKDELNQPDHDQLPYGSKNILRSHVSIPVNVDEAPLVNTAASLNSLGSRPPSRSRRFSSTSTRDVAEWGQTVEEDEVFADEYYEEAVSRGASHRSLYSTRSSRAGEQTEENLLQAQFNSSRQPSIGSLGRRSQFIPPKEEWLRTSSNSVHPNENDEYAYEQMNTKPNKTEMIRSANQLSTVESVQVTTGASIDLREEVVIPFNIPIPMPRSRSASVASRRSDAVAFAEQPELYSHPDEKFGVSIDGIPYRSTKEHDKTPQLGGKKQSRMVKQYESDEDALGIQSSASATSIVDNTPPPSAGFTTPKSRNSRDSYAGTNDLSMPSPFNQTQFHRDEYEAHKEKQRASASMYLRFGEKPSFPPARAESATQTGETLARVAGQRFAYHYGASVASYPKAAPARSTDVFSPEAGDAPSAPPPRPPSSSPPPLEEQCVKQHHYEMYDRDGLLLEQQQQQQQEKQGYDQGVAPPKPPHTSSTYTTPTPTTTPSRFHPLPSCDMSYVEQYQQRSSASRSSVHTAIYNDIYDRPQEYYLHPMHRDEHVQQHQQQRYQPAALSASFATIGQAPPVKAEESKSYYDEHHQHEYEEASSKTTSTTVEYGRRETDDKMISIPVGSVAQKAAVFQQVGVEQLQQKKHQDGTQFKTAPNNTATVVHNVPIGRSVPINVVPKAPELPKVYNVEIKRAEAPPPAPPPPPPAPVIYGGVPRNGEPNQPGSYVHIERPRMNSSFERRNHPAAAVLNNFLSAHITNTCMNSSSRSDESTTVRATPSSPPSYIPPPMKSSLPPPSSTTPHPSSSYAPSPPSQPPKVTSPSGYQRVVRPLRSEDATFHYEMKHDINSQLDDKQLYLYQQKTAQNVEISKDEHQVLARVGAIRADNMEPSRQRSLEAERAYTTYHDKKNVESAIRLNSVPKPYNPAEQYKAAPQPIRPVQPPQQLQRPASFIPTQGPPKTPVTAINVSPVRRPDLRREVVIAPSEPAKYTGSTIRRAIPKRGHIRNLAAAFDNIQVQADREATVVDAQSASRRASATSSPTSSHRAMSSTIRGDEHKRQGVGQLQKHQEQLHEQHQKRVNEQHQQQLHQLHREQQVRRLQQQQQDHLEQMKQQKGHQQEHQYQYHHEEERRVTEQRVHHEYNQQSVEEWQAANERLRARDEQLQQRTQQMKEQVERAQIEQTRLQHEYEQTRLQHEREMMQMVEETRRREQSEQQQQQRWNGAVRSNNGVERAVARSEERSQGDDDDAELILDSGSSSRPGSIGIARGTIPVHALRTSTPLAGVKNDGRTLARALAQIPSIRGDDTIERGRGRVRPTIVKGATSGGVRALASRFESVAAEEASRARATSATPRMKRKTIEIRRLDTDELEDRKEAASRRLARGYLIEKERRRSHSAHPMTRKRREDSSTDSGEEAVMRDMEVVERMAREELRKNERHEEDDEEKLSTVTRRETKTMRDIEQERVHGQIDEMFNVLEGESATSCDNLTSGGVIGVARSHGGQSGEDMRMSSGHRLYEHTHEEQHIDRRGGSSQTLNTHHSSGLVYSRALQTSVYRETGRQMRGTGGASGTSGGGLSVAGTSTVGAAGLSNTTAMSASSPHFSPVNLRGTEAAGQRVATYESRDGRNPIRVPSRSVRPYALATSTPRGTVHSSQGRNLYISANEEGLIGREAVEDDSFLSSISGMSGGSGGGAGHASRSAANAAEYKKQISRLNNVQSMEEEKISITTKALQYARKKQNPTNELAAQRTLLLARLRVTALKRELQRLSALAIVRNPPPPVSKSVLGAMDISDISLHLNRNLSSRSSDGGSCSFGFIVVLKCGVEVEATAPVTMLVGQKPTGLKHLRFSNLPVDFTIRLEVYVMKLREPKEESCTAVLATKARNLLVPGTRRQAITAGSGGSNVIGGSGSSCGMGGDLPVGELIRCGHTALDRDSVGPIRLYLDAAEYPLEGTIELASRCSRLPSAVEVDLRGFLTMYKVVGGYGSWVRYWAVLRRGIINFWKYPDDEQLDRGGPVASADLSKCTDGEIMAAPREICTRQFAFSIDMLVATTPSIVEKKRVLLAADTRDQLKAWLASLNETLAAIRA